MCYKMLAVLSFGLLVFGFLSAVSTHYKEDFNMERLREKAVCSTSRKTGNKMGRAEKH